MKYKFLQLDKDNVEDFCHLRMALFQELGEINENMDISNLKLATKEYYLSHINKDLFSWGIFQEKKIVAIGSLCLFNRIPYRENLTGVEGYILNIYTSPEVRKKGSATQILENIIEYSKKNGIKKLWLNSSEQGKFLYIKKGFREKNNELELFL